MKLTLYLCFALKAPTNRRDFGLFAFDNTASIFEKGAKGKEKDSSTRCRSAVKSAKHHLCKIWRNLNLDSLQNVRDSKEIKLMPELPEPFYSTEYLHIKEGQIPYLDSLSSGDVVTRLEQL